MKSFRLFLTLISCCLFFALTAPAQETDPLAELLIKKGLLTREEVGQGQVSRDELVRLLQKKGILTESEAKAMKESVATSAARSSTPTFESGAQAQATVSEAPAAGGASLPKWINNLSIKGDIRFRYEGFDFDGSGLGAPDKKQRNRLRERARIGMEKSWDDGVTAGIRVATQNNADEGEIDAISTNDTLGDNLDPDSIFVDRAYIAYGPDIAWAPWITGGRFENPFSSSNMVFDPDLNLEGLAEKFTFAPTEDLSLYGIFGQITMNESGGGKDAILWAWQGGVKYAFTDAIGADLAIAYYNYQNPDASQEMRDEATGAGNSGVDNDGDGDVDELAFDFRVIDILLQFSLEVMERPLKVWFDYAFNNGDSNAGVDPQEDTAWGVGGSFGKLKEQHDWEVGVMYKHIEADSVLGAFPDSDFEGVNRKGVVFSAGYQALKHLSLNFALFMTSNIDETFNTVEQDFTRWQVDAIVKF